MKKSTVCLFIFLLLFFPLVAEEGMWMLHLLRQQKLKQMQQMGLELEDVDLYNPDGSSLKDAVVQFGRGCTGEVVSSRGLLLTNHHCGYGQIQQHSTLEHNYLEDGFWAISPEEELPNPGLTVTFIEGIEEVTDWVKGCLERDREEDKEGLFYLSPSYLNRLAREKVGERYLTDHFGTEVEIRPFFDGNQYYLFTKKVYSDIRLVGAPPSGIGKFGADTDNWMWPRHTGDFSLFRIYADREGNPAPYAVTNVPLRPKRWLTLSTAGVEEGDFAMMLGFPGSTHTYYTSWEVDERREIDNAVRIAMRSVRQEAMLEEMLRDPAVKIQYASKYSGSTNGYKNAIGSSWAIEKHDFVRQKSQLQERLLHWSAEHHKPQYPDALNKIEQIVTGRAGLRYRSWMLNEGIIRAIEFASLPTETAQALATALEAGDSEQSALLAERLEEEYHLFANKDYNREVDRKVAKAMLKAYIAGVEKEYHPACLSSLYNRFGGDTGRFVDHLLDHSLFGDKEKLRRFLGDPHAEELQQDPLFGFARSVQEEAHSLRRELSAFDTPFLHARRTWLEGVLAMEGHQTLFPDANLTLRLTYGQVKGYRPRDGVLYIHQTTLEGVMEKEDPDNWEFVVPDRLKQLYQAADYGNYALPDGRMPVAFAATTHTTGGNSGSPVLNGRGELVGINFDRNWEGVGGDISYLPDYQRSIIVDIRYVLFVIDRYAGAGHLLEEMDLRSERFKK